MRDPHDWPSRLGGTTFRSPRSLTSPGATVTSRNSVAAEHGPVRGGRPILEAGDEALDAEPAVAADPDVPGQDALLGGPLRERCRRCS